MMKFENDLTKSMRDSRAHAQSHKQHYWHLRGAFTGKDLSVV